MKLPNLLKNVFWDVTLENIDPVKNRDYIIARVAEKGRWRDILWLKKNYKKNAIKKAVMASRNASLKTKNFWSSL